LLRTFRGLQTGILAQYCLIVWRGRKEYRRCAKKSTNVTKNKTGVTIRALSFQSPVDRIENSVSSSPWIKRSTGTPGSSLPVSFLICALSTSMTWERTATRPETGLLISSGFDSWENATNQQRESGGFDFLLHAPDQLRPSRPKHVLDANDCFINSLLSIGIKRFRACGHLVSGSPTFSVIARKSHPDMGRPLCNKCVSISIQR
jgi:hypothetical protein